MANSLSKGTLIAYDEVMDGFDAECVVSREVMTRRSDPQAMQRAGDVEYMSQEMYANVVTGLDLTAANKTDVIDRKVPVVYRTPSNVWYELDALQMRDPEYMRQMGIGARKALAADIDTAIMNNIASWGGIVVAKTGDYSWDMASEAEAQLVVRGVTAGMDRKHFLNAFDAQKVSKDLGNRAYIGDLSKGAYERSQLPPIANFRTFRTDQLINSVVTGTVTSTLVNGANQKLTVAAMTGGGLIQDNRTMTLNCDGANVANVKAGDTFTLPNVFAVHQITKASTGVLQTFRVLSNTAGALLITPAIIVDGPYQNVTAAPADNADLTFLNTATKPIDPFLAQDSCVLSFGRLAADFGAGMNVTRATTKNGCEIMVMEQANITTGKTIVRFTTLYGTAVLQPEKCGFIVANQV